VADCSKRELRRREILCLATEFVFVITCLQEQQSPLHVAARLGNVDNVVLLLQHGATPDCATYDLYTPLHIAAKEGHDEVAQALLDQGANQDLQTMVRQRPRLILVTRCSFDSFT